MHQEVDCTQCTNYEYTDNSYSNNCIHYAKCFNAAQENKPCQHNWVEDSTTRGYNEMGVVLYRTYYTCSLCGQRKCVDIVG